MTKIEDEEPEEEPKDLVALMKKMEKDFNQGVQNSNIDHSSPGEALNDSYESDSYHVEE